MGGSRICGTRSKTLPRALYPSPARVFPPQAGLPDRKVQSARGCTPAITSGRDTEGRPGWLRESAQKAGEAQIGRTQGAESRAHRPASERTPSTFNERAACCRRSGLFADDRRSGLASPAGCLVSAGIASGSGFGHAIERDASGGGLGTEYLNKVSRWLRSRLSSRQLEDRELGHLRLCGRCRGRMFVSRRCDRGQICCNEGCARPAR